MAQVSSQKDYTRHFEKLIELFDLMVGKGEIHIAVQKDNTGIEERLDGVLKSLDRSEETERDLVEVLVSIENSLSDIHEELHSQGLVNRTRICIEKLQSFFSRLLS